MIRRRRVTRPLPDSPTILIPESSSGVLQVCHPDWRGVHASALAFGDPVVEARDLNHLIPSLESLEVPPSLIVIQGWPPGASDLAEAADRLGIRVNAVFHSSPAQHGIDGGESEAVAEMLRLLDQGLIERVGTVKAGMVKAFTALGLSVEHVPNRVPVVPNLEPAEVASGTNVGIFLAPMWRKNVTTQILAALSNSWHPYVMERPLVPYLADGAVSEVGLLAKQDLLAIQAAMDISFNVTLSECHPMMPMEAYRLGVPCLMSRTSDLFESNPDLYELTTVPEADNVDAVAIAGRRLLDNRDIAVTMANEELDRTDRIGATRWLEFTGRDT